jgi:2',3'-cyclic-nucleotide 2'-phosphodiesterase/3'-nucleotidase/5'-nucleotidase
MAPKWQEEASLSKIGAFTNADGSGAENTAYDAETGRLFVTNTEANTVDVVSLGDPTAPKHEFSIPVPDGFEVRDIDIHGSTLAVALAAGTVDDRSLVAFHDALTGETIRQVEVGFSADEIQFSPNGTQLAVANSGEPDFSDPAMPIDPPGSISLIDLSRGLVNASVQSVDFTQFDGHESELRAEGIRLRPDATSSADLAPEGIAFAPHGELWVTLQQNNALAVISIDRNGLEIERLIPLGAKDHSLPGNGLDASDADGQINIQNWPVFGLYTPDEIASFKARGETYFIITNEGDPTKFPVEGELADETVRVRDVTLDGSAFPNATDLQEDVNLGRLQVSRFEGDTDSDGDKDILYAYGARSFSILNDHGKLVFDSGDDFEQIVASRIPSLFNAPIDDNTFDDRSDNRGPQPEGIAIGKVEGHTYAFIGLHTQGGVMAYDVSDPNNARFVDYINTRDQAQVGGDLGTKGLTFIGPDDSPTGNALIAAAHSESGTVAIYDFNTHHGSDWLL